MLRFARLPRLWRIVRIVRLVKVTRSLQDSKQYRKITEFFNLNSGIQGIIRILLTVMLLNHAVSCLWFMLAKMDDFAPETWAARLGVVDEDFPTQYTLSFYWSFMTLSTVGFGDINAKTLPERIFAIIWMIFGIGFYSYTIGNMTTLIASTNNNS